MSQKTQPLVRVADLGDQGGDLCPFPGSPAKGLLKRGPALSPFKGTVRPQTVDGGSLTLRSPSQSAVAQDRCLRDPDTAGTLETTGGVASHLPCDGARGCRTLGQDVPSHHPCRPRPWLGPSTRLSGRLGLPVATIPLPSQDPQL